MSHEELENWEKGNSFKSYRSVLVDADRDWASIDSEDKQASFLAKYQDVLSIEDGALVPHIKIFMYQSITNREGVYRTGNHYHKVVGDYILTVKKEDFNKLVGVKSESIQSLESDDVRVYQYTYSNGKDGTINSKTQATCSSDQYFKQAEYYYNPSK